MVNQILHLSLIYRNWGIHYIAMLLRVGRLMVLWLHCDLAGISLWYVPLTHLAYESR
jgi:hypothetical protein